VYPDVLYNSHNNDDDDDDDDDDNNNNNNNNNNNDDYLIPQPTNQPTNNQPTEKLRAETTHR
jgi:hypothetical protein